MINDRGNQKWTSMMIPEHVNMLNQMWKELEYKDKPTLDEQQIEENANKLQFAVYHHRLVEVKYFADHDFHFIKGKLERIVSNESLVFNDEDKSRVNFDDVIAVAVE